MKWLRTPHTVPKKWSHVMSALELVVNNSESEPRGRLVQAIARNYFVTPGLVVNSNESEPRGHFINVKVRIRVAAPHIGSK